ncbi:S8/S53 family peptidase [Roseomonas sp. CAU 1739]|uniref:S8/S53 family peptidase n=1 Tax=Roseomonas sp. CAU 1739 TaxID=3140364 RepID=UPI00325A73BF
MPDHDMPRLVMVVPNWRDLDNAYADRDLRGVEEELKQRLNDRLMTTLTDGERALVSDFRVDYLASNGTVPVGLTIEPAALRRRLVCGIVMTGGESAAELLAVNIRRAYGDEAAIGADLTVRAAAVVDIDRFWTHWCPGEAPYGLFGRRGAALRAMGATAQHLANAGLPVPGPSSLRVNLVSVDTGLPMSLIRPIGTFPGWNIEVTDASGTTVRRPGDPLTGHGAMVASNALACAPGVTVLDCPVIPDGIMNLDLFLGVLVAAMHRVTDAVELLKGDDIQEGRPPRSWVVCNAWGVFDPSRESSSVPYSSDPNHPLTTAFRDLAQLDVDIVFAAGNCGQFCPNNRCGPDFIGPGRSINGANAMPEALTVGAVRSDGLWLGYSSQGPGITGLAHDKPDLCAPSQFENDDDAGSNTGTSAACGLAAGAVALLRTRWPSATVDPATLRAVLRDTAVQPYGPQGWQERTGHGVINVAAAAAALNAI